MNTNHFELIRKWATERNIVAESDFESQYLKGVTEIAEVITHVLKNKHDMLRNDIGNVIVCLTNAFACNGIKIEEALKDFNLTEVVYPALFITSKETGKLDVTELKKLSRVILDEYINVGDDVLEWDLIGLDQITALFTRLRDLASFGEWSLNDCLEASYNSIKDSHGLMSNVTSVK